ncbi:MAG TPA: ATP-dependent Clp protease proteolytic subunit [Candidatus Mediterraneibacter norfolkensis]|nr:ATP-dependent Clp protease proteolytic subunit [Candidatus Mediterraneibacter norfolkensis]
MNRDDQEQTKTQQRERENNEIREMGTLELQGKEGKNRIQLLTIIGEIEGHEAVSGNTKATKYEHLLPRLAEIEADDETEGVLILLNTLGGDVEAGLAIAEMIASLSKPTVSLVLGGSHSIGGPLAVSADYSFIVPTGTMIVHPVRSTGMFIGVIQSYRNMEKTQDRIARFISEHSRISQERLLELMLDSTQLVKDVGTMLEGEEAVREGIIDEVGGISQAYAKLQEMIRKKG